jgi:hypothetical protein
MTSRRSTDTDDSTGDEATLLGGISPEKVHDLLPTADEFGRGILGDQSE